MKVKGQIGEGGLLTASFSARRNGEIVQNRGENFWEGRDLEKMMDDSGAGYFTFKIPDFIKEKDELMISLWSRNPTASVYIESIEVWSLENIWN